MKIYSIAVLLAMTGVLSFSSCNWFKKSDTNQNTENSSTQEKPLVKTPAFSADSSYSFVKAQVDFGPRTPNSSAHDKCADWMIQKAKQFADTVYVQRYTVVGFDGKQIKSKNIIASFNPQAKNRILLSAHWDTRPFADQDTADREKPIDGANDGGSGVGILLEVARAIQSQPIKIGVDIIFWDSEDYGQPADSKLPQKEDTYCLGSQYWAKNTHIPNYRADFGINLDMVGSGDAVFTREQVSVYNADWVSQYVWGTAAKLGYSSLFSSQLTGAMTDDHLYVNQIAKIPMIDIIHYDSNGFGKYWHTHRDNMDVISKGTLTAVGRTLLQVVYQYDSDKK